MPVTIRAAMLNLAMALLLTACGGGGGGDSGNTNPPTVDTSMDWDQDNWDEKDWT